MRLIEVVLTAGTFDQVSMNEMGGKTDATSSPITKKSLCALSISDVSLRTTYNNLTFKSSFKKVNWHCLLTSLC